MAATVQQASKHSRTAMKMAVVTNHLAEVVVLPFLFSDIYLK